MENELLGNKKVPQINSLNDLINELRATFQSDKIDVNYIHDLMSAYKSNPKDWIQFAHFDSQKYTRNLVDTGNGKYNLMILAWAEGQGSKIHDHANSHCFMKMLSGSLFEQRFEWPKQNQDIETMKSIGEFEIKTNEVAYINDSIGLHRVENRSHTTTACSLHLYCPPYSKCMLFDQRTGQKSVVKVTFYSKFGQKTQFKNNKHFDDIKSIDFPHTNSKKAINN